MPFRVTIEELYENPDDAIEPLRREVLRMTVDTLNLPAVISAIQSKPRKARTPKVDK